MSQDTFLFFAENKKRTMGDHTIIEETIRLANEGISVTLPVNGWSMLPFIIGGSESVILRKPTMPERGQVVLAKVSPDRYVVHRIVSIDGDRVTLMGDGNIAGTEQCCLTDLKAVATHVVDRNGKQYYLYCPWRRKAARLWCRLLPVRRWILAIYRRTYLKMI